MTTKVQLVSNIVGNVSGGASFTGIITASSFSGSLTGSASTASFATTSFGLSGTPNLNVDIVTATEYDITGSTNTLNASGLNVGIVTATEYDITGSTNTLNASGLNVGIVTALDTRILSIGEKSTRIDGNTASLVYNTGGGNIAICTNATGNITLAVSGIPTSSNFDNNSITFSVCSLNTGTARSCTAVTLNGLSATIRWAGGSLGNAIAGVTTSSGMDIYSFSGINTVGSASTTANYYLLGVVNGGYR